MNFLEKVQRRIDIRAVLFLAVLVCGAFVAAGYAIASGTSSFTQTISAGVLSTDIVDGSYNPVGSPSISMGGVTFSFGTQIAAGSFGTASENIYVQNPDGADNGWTLSLAAPLATNTWTSGGLHYDFNDPTGSGYTDGGDADAVGGQMTVDPTSNGQLNTGQCSGGCATSNISLGGATPFNQGVADSVTLLNAAASSSDIGDWILQDVDISQKIPAQQAAANDYALNLVLSVTAL